MRARHVTMLFAVLMAAEAPLMAADSATTDQAKPAPAKPALDPDKQICRSIPELGSLVRANRVCKTRKEWADDREAQRRQIDRAQIKGTKDGL